MAFHFQPQADSSDDEAVDLSSWTAVAQQKPARAPLATIEGGQQCASEESVDLPTIQDNGSGVEDGGGSTMQQDGGDGISEDERIVPFTALPTNSALRTRQPSEDPTVSPSFTSISKLASPPSTEDEREQDISAFTSQPKRVLIPAIPRISRGNLSDDVLDFTEGRDTVRRVKGWLASRRKDKVFKVEFHDRHVEQLRLEELLQYEDGQVALDAFESSPPQESSTEAQVRMPSTRPNRKAVKRDGFIDTVDAVSDDEGDMVDESRTRGRKRKQLHTQYIDQSESDADEDSGTEEEQPKTRLRLRNSRSLRSDKHSTYTNGLDNDGRDSDDAPFLNSDLPGNKRRWTKLRLRGPKAPDMITNGIGYDRNRRGAHIGERQSGRSTRHQGGMQEVGENEIYRSDSDNVSSVPVRPKAVVIREQFMTLPRNDDFRMRHIQQCDTCGQDANFAPLIYCQGCTLAYHKSCLGVRSTRDHLVTKVSPDFSVLQCRRCISVARKKDSTAPDQGRCADCREHGTACLPFRARKTTAQEQKEREDNEGVDPIYQVDSSRINQADNVLFRCMFCWRAFHFQHLPSRSNVLDMETEVDADQRFREYSRDWKCKECLENPVKVSGLIAWKPVDEDSYDPGLPLEKIDEDEKAYLVKWDGMSYFRACWMPGAWVWGITAASMRKAFAKRDDSHHPKMRTEDAIPEDYLRADIVLDIKYTSIVDIRTEEIDKARIREVDKALIKYRGLGYEDAVWEAPPSPEDGERWADFVMAYNDWVLGRYVHTPRGSLLKARLDKARTQDFTQLEKEKQPDNVEGGELMKYQIEGLNWLYYKWFTQKNAILADEMGLGKTIQIIGFLATLVADHKCFPFLVVVPNSTCPNWRRELKRWAPSLRVVAYYGSKESRDLAYRYELFPEGSKDLRCHIVVTSYDTAQDESSRKFLRNVRWQGLIVDEGQRLKNDKNLLYAALGALKCPFRILLTGTPLQNNQRELFNLLHFLDENYNAAQLEEEYADLDTNKITKLHDMIRPFFLRRTKAQVLTFLPPMAQIIVPVSMTIVQKKLYRIILAKNPDLIKAIFSSETALKQTERASLNNILMQLRKCLCHPFVYSSGIEDRTVSYSASHRNLVDASSKLKLLEILLPKLKERGHRILIFSQFLDMLNMVEDFLDGMRLQYQRLDGTISALQRQKRIDEFNAPDSPLFAFLLSTRAGGVGINLASADTVIILDPDFNPHQDIQALSRAHRIGQHKKVLCFQLVTRASAEERIMQMGRKKLALDHVLIQEMDADDADQNDLVSVLRYGASELFEDTGDQDIMYDGPSVERLLDRSRVEDTKSGADKSAETQFSFARVWANDEGELQNEMTNETTEDQQAPDPGVWANILKERERIAAEEATAKADAYGRGLRARGAVDYNGDRSLEGVEGVDITPMKANKHRNSDESDTDFLADGSDVEDDFEDEGEAELDGDEVQTVDGEGDGAKQDTGRKKAGKHAPSTPKAKGGLPSSANSPLKLATKPKPNSLPKGSSISVKTPNGKAGKKASAVPPASKSKVASPKASPPNKKKTSAAPIPSSSKTQPESAAGRGETSLSTGIAHIDAPRPSAQPDPLQVDSTGHAHSVVYISDDDSLPTFKRAIVPVVKYYSLDGIKSTSEDAVGISVGFNCTACRAYHPPGQCPIKLAGVEYCNLCGMAHYGSARVCPHIQSETQVRQMLEALKQSNEPDHLVTEARRYLRGLKGNLVQLKKQAEAKKHAAREAQKEAVFQMARAPVWGIS